MLAPAIALPPPFPVLIAALSPATLNRQAESQLAAGQPNLALETWQQAERGYRAGGDRTGELGTQINQARALQALGFYRQAQARLQTVFAALSAHSDPALKLTAWLNLGNVLRVTGDLTQSQHLLQQALTLAHTLHSPTAVPTVALSLGNTMLAIAQPQAALALYQQAAAESSPVRLAAQLRQLDLLIELHQLALAQPLQQQLQQELATAPVDQTHLNARLELADSWLHLLQAQSLPTSAKAVGCVATTCAAPVSLTKTLVGRSDNATPLPVLVLNPVMQLLQQSVAQARSLHQPRAESYAWGKLGHIYEVAQHWSAANQATEQAAAIAQSMNAADLGYQWQWQLGRLDVKQNDVTGAIAHYTTAFNHLQVVRQDLMAIHQEAQFSFREQVEPVYREFVSLLLRDVPTLPTAATSSDLPRAKLEAKTEPVALLDHSPLQRTHQRLQVARQVIESLRLAQLANFFREACLEVPTRAIDQIDPTAAVFYPIILPDRLEVILALPGQPLSHYTTHQPQAEVETVISQMRQSLRSTSFAPERLAIAQQLYQWLVQPAAAELIRLHIKTLVFALDGDLQNLPMAALHTGKHYLIEQYSVAVTPSLQLFAPAKQPRRQALIGGLSQANPNADRPFSALPAVPQEVSQIRAALPAQVLLDQAFTTEALHSAMQTAPVSILHLATHGQFSSKAEETFILTWDGQISLQDIDTWLMERTFRGMPPIDLLVLSACQTAKGDKQAALGLAGMAVRSGARSTLASLWAVNDQSTAQFMAQFYRSFVQSGVSKAEAVRLAQLKLMATSEFNHPYYWAPFILVGYWL